MAYANKTCALKIFRAGTSSFAQLCDEAAILLGLNYPTNHANVLQLDFVSFIKESKELHFLMEVIHISRRHNLHSPRSPPPLLSVR